MKLVNKKVDFTSNLLPLSGELIEQVKLYDSKELYWLSGYCSGLADARQNQHGEEVQVESNSQPSTKLKTVVLYASQTGNAQSIAESLFQSLGDAGLDSEIASVADFKLTKLKDQQIILLVASTHGEGEAPDDAIEFHEFLLGKKSPKLDGRYHSVLSLGDSSYEFFCQTGKDFDNALTKQGSQALVKRVDCDLDFQQLSMSWISDVVAEVSRLNGELSTQRTVNAEPLAAKAVYSKESPFLAKVLTNQRVTARGSTKHINHLEFSLDASGISYQPGDSLGVWPKNNHQTILEILSLVDLSGTEIVSVNSKEISLTQALSDRLEISLLNKGFIEQYGALSANEEIIAIAQGQFSSYSKNHQVVDVISLSPLKLQPQQLVDLLKPLKPRMYSIASSLAANPEEVHLTVALEQAENESTTRLGTASHFLVNNLEEDDEVEIFVEANRHFKLPDNNQPVIMIGPGTGIAPFRSFLQHREELDAKGDNWLFFGNPHFNSDFLYQVELQKLLSKGVLTRLDLAFSRDQATKIYVQDRILEQAGELWDWINNRNAYLYVCGDMAHMAKDVHSALITIISQQGNQSLEDAEIYLKALKKDKRYQRDVY